MEAVTRWMESISTQEADTIGTIGWSLLLTGVAVLLFRAQL